MKLTVAGVEFERTEAGWKRCAPYGETTLSGEFFNVMELLAAAEQRADRWRALATEASRTLVIGKDWLARFDEMDAK